jgi:hypothetical protein
VAVKFRKRTLDELASLVVGDKGVEPGSTWPQQGIPQESKYFPYRSSWYITQFFRELDTDWEHDGSTRARWVAEVLEQILAEPHPDPLRPPETFCRLIDELMSPADAHNEGMDRANALRQLNEVLIREGFEAFYGEDRHCYLRNLGTGAVSQPPANPHRPLSAAEIKRRADLETYLGECSEDELIEQVLLPLFRQLGFQRITAAGHRDKALEYGKDVWMRFRLPTQHYLYFGIQAKRGKIDAAGMSRDGNTNVAEIYNQVLMMIGHEIFDPETNRAVLVDHALIVAGGEITKAARNWIANKLDTSRRSQIMFMDRNDILNLFVVTNLALPSHQRLSSEPDPWSDPWDSPGEPPPL